MEGSEKFDHLSSKIVKIFYGRTEGTRNIISNTLDELNSLNYRYPIVKNTTKVMLLINRCCNYISTEDVETVKKFIKLIIVLVNDQSISVEGPTLLLSVQWCCEVMKVDNQNVVLDALKALEALLRNKVHHTTNILDRVIGDIDYQIKKAKNEEKKEKSMEIILSGLLCLEASTIFPENLETVSVNNFFPHLEKCARLFLITLCDTGISPTHCGILETSLLGLQHIIAVYPGCLEKELGLVLGIVKSYMLYNLIDVEFLKPAKLMPSTLSIPEIPVPFAKKGDNIKKTRVRRRKLVTANDKKKDKSSGEEKDNNSCTHDPASTVLDYSSDTGCKQSNLKLKSSDSEFSDGEAGKWGKLRHSPKRVREASLNLFYCVIKNTDNSTIFPFWSSFIPENPSVGKHNLITCILKDPSIRGKMCALNVLLILLTTSKLYLTQAESSEKTSSFTPFCVALGMSLTELHRSLCLALKEVCGPVLAQVLKCLSALVQVTPYHRMSHGLVTGLVGSVQAFIFHKDPSVQVTALIVVGCVLVSASVHPEVKQAMLLKKEQQEIDKPVVEQLSTSEDCDDDFEYAQFSSDEEDSKPDQSSADAVPWLVKRCLRNLGVHPHSDAKTAVVSATVKVESLRIFSSMSENYFEYLVLPHLNLITEAVKNASTDSFEDLRLVAAKVIEDLGLAMSKLADSEVTAACLNFWKMLLNSPLVDLIQNEQNPALRAAGCHCLASIGPYLFQQFPRNKQILCVTLLFSCTKDEACSVRGAAVRALAFYVLFPTLREDMGFVTDTAENILECLRVENVPLKTRAAWSLGNLTDSLVLNRSIETSEEKLPAQILLRLFEAGIETALDNDKMKMHGMRALGSLIFLLDSELLKRQEFKNCCFRAIDSLVRGFTTGTNTKVRWNACHALGSALKNPFLYSDLDVNVWQASVFNNLSAVVIDYKNFKVRINAALALASPASREKYGPFFYTVWEALVKSLENAQNTDNFQEYKHRDQLSEQICITLGHLTSLLTKEDLLFLQGNLDLYLDMMRSHMQKVLDGLLPEKSSQLLSASLRLNDLELRKDLNANERQIIVNLKHLFTSHVM